MPHHVRPTRELPHPKPEHEMSTYLLPFLLKTDRAEDHSIISWHGETYPNRQLYHGSSMTANADEA